MKRKTYEKKLRRGRGRAVLGRTRQAGHGRGDRRKDRALRDGEVRGMWTFLCMVWLAWHIDADGREIA